MRKFYNYTYYIQINLSSINGLTVKRNIAEQKFEELPSLGIPEMKHVLSTGEDAKQEDQKNEEWVLFQGEKNGKEEIDEVFRKKALFLSKQPTLEVNENLE